MKKPGYGHTFVACYIGIFIQAIVCGFAPLLFLIFNRDYGIPLVNITLLSTVNYVAQFATDVAAVFFVEKIGYRRAAIIAHFLAAAGFFCLGAVAPNMESVYPWILFSVVLFSVGGGLMEVILSPVVEGCPSKNKSAAMSLLHSMFGFGSATVILVTTLLLAIFGSQSWRYIALLWAVFPLVNMFYFGLVPINEVGTKSERTSVASLFKSKTFWGFMLVMACGGAAEIGMSQWASAFAESSLGVSKAVGDVLGPCAFAIMMALSRLTYAKMADRINLSRCILLCGVFGAVCYLVAALVPLNFAALIACGICGFAVGILWPGTLSLAAKAYPAGGAALFALMALGGDLGCTLGPTTVGFVASAFGGEIRAGLLAGTVFPVILVVGLLLLGKDKAQK